MIAGLFNPRAILALGFVCAAFAAHGGERAMREESLLVLEKEQVFAVGEDVRWGPRGMEPSFIKVFFQGIWTGLKRAVILVLSPFLILLVLYIWIMDSWMHDGSGLVEGYIKLFKWKPFRILFFGVFFAAWAIFSVSYVF